MTPVTVFFGTLACTALIVAVLSVARGRKSISTMVAFAFLVLPITTAAAATAECAKVWHNRTEAQNRCPRALHTADFELAINICMEAAQDADAFTQRVACNAEQYYANQLDIAHWLLDAAYAARELGLTERAARYTARARALIVGVKNNRHASAEIRKIAAFDLNAIHNEPLDVRF